MSKIMKGLYEIVYQIYEIELPYSSHRFYYAGPKSGAESAAKRLKKKYKNPYAFRIKMIHG